MYVSVCIPNVRFLLPTTALLMSCNVLYIDVFSATVFLICPINVISFDVVYYGESKFHTQYDETGSAKALAAGVILRFGGVNC